MTTVIIIVLLLVGWDILWYFAGVKPLFPWQLKKLLRERSYQLSLIDVRTPREYKWFHLKRAINKPELLLNFNTLPAISEDEPVIVICMTGHRSPPVAYRLKKHGFKNVYNLTWGMVAWKLLGMTNDDCRVKN